MECIELNWLYKHMKKIKSNQPAILCTEMIKNTAFPCEYHQITKRFSWLCFLPKYLYMIYLAIRIFETYFLIKGIEVV